MQRAYLVVTSRKITQWYIIALKKNYVYKGDMFLLQQLKAYKPAYHIENKKRWNYTVACPLIYNM